MLDYLYAENHGVTAISVSSLIGILMGVVAFGFPVFILLFYSYYHNQISDELFGMRYGALTKDLNFFRIGRACLLFLVSQQVRLFGLAFIATYHNDKPIR